MVVLITGSTGFIGSRLAQALRAAGHVIVHANRRASAPPGERAVEIDFTRDHEPAAWRGKLDGVDAVVNAVGILREHGLQTFDAIHRAGPIALFAAARDAGVQRLVQVSALGADAQATSAYHRSKKAADDALAAIDPHAAIVQPSLVYGAGGTSAALFERMAVLPWIPVPGDGEQRVQPIHVDDAVAAIVALLASRAPAGGRIALVGPAPLTLASFLLTLREALGLPRGRLLRVPMTLVRFAATVGEKLPGALLDRETLGMLTRGNTADPAATRALLGRDPRPVRRFVEPANAIATRIAAKLATLLPLMRIAIAFVWIATAIVSLGIFPVEQSYELLARVGVPAALQPTMLYGAALLDLAFGVGTLALRRRRPLWLAQVALIALYTALISWKLPEFWLHPYGPLTKNVPMLAVLIALYALEDREWTT